MDGQLWKETYRSPILTSQLLQSNFDMQIYRSLIWQAKFMAGHFWKA